jgi:hypothetical protein
MDKFIDFLNEADKAWNEMDEKRNIIMETDRKE